MILLDDGDDGTSLDGRGTLETVGVDTTEELVLELHVVEVVNDGLPVGLDLAIGDVEVVASIGRSGGGGSLLGPEKCGKVKERRVSMMVSSDGSSRIIRDRGSLEWECISQC